MVSETKTRCGVGDNSSAHGRLMLTLLVILSMFAWMAPTPLGVKTSLLSNSSASVSASERSADRFDLFDCEIEEEEDNDENEEEEHPRDELARCSPQGDTPDSTGSVVAPVLDLVLINESVSSHQRGARAPPVA